ncbi:MAG: cysteine desulfurase [Proteobacteria bacterium]|nr:cysteine desulfurase [Pseudomonadota bacterium]HQR04735.1 cysteine desulfurase family protein [Rhodocyclaceae bacterium]
MSLPTYMDHNATTPVAPVVLEAMLPFLSRQCGNPSSNHEYGRAAKRALDEARQQVAAAVGAHPTEVIFTSGGTEANNLVLKGAAQAMKPGILALSAMEHPSVRSPAEQLLRQGWQLRSVAIDDQGRVDDDDFLSALTENPRLISVMRVNNETGTMQNVAALAARAKVGGSRAWFHSDCVQALGKVAIDFRDLNRQGVHALTLSAHKIHGPKGAGAVVADKRLELMPQIAGGGQERDLRSGTENMAAIVGFGAACTAAMADLEAGSLHLARMRAELEEGLVELGARIFSRGAERVANTVYFAIPDIDGETLVGKLDRVGYAVSSGTTCSSANHEPSATLLAMGVSPELAKSAVRVSLGRDNTLTQIHGLLENLAALRDQLLNLTAISS